MKKIERYIIDSLPIRFFLLKSKNWKWKIFDYVPLYNIIRFFYRQIKTVDINERCAAISYNVIMALPPALLFLFTLLPNLPFIKKYAIKSQIHEFIQTVIPLKKHNENVIAFIDTLFGKPKFGLLSTGFLLSLFFASNAMMAIMRSFNKNYIGFKQRKGLYNRLISIRLTIILFFLTISSFILLLLKANFLKTLNVKNPLAITLITGLKWPIFILLLFFSLAYIYKYAPAVQKKWRLLNPGALLACFLIIIATLVFSAFVNSFGKYNFLYGTIGSVIVVMSLIYINTLMLLIGFELNVSIDAAKYNFQKETEKQCVENEA